MDYREFIDTVLSDVCADHRVKNGSFDLANPKHLDVLREYVVDYTDDEFAEELFNEMKRVVDGYLSIVESAEMFKHMGIVDEGNYPERQAYNENGVLVTFPDAESKKAAIERGSHFENPPGGSSSGSETDDGSDSSVEDEEDDGEAVNVFSTTETPEQKRDREEQEFGMSVFGTDLSPEDIKLRDEEEDGESDQSEERNRLYDILKGIKTAKQGGEGESATFTLDKLHPSVLFALSEKWVFDKSGDWYNEEGKFRGNTDRRGQVHPSRPRDKEKMGIWIEDHEKRKSGMELPDKNSP